MRILITEWGWESYGEMVGDQFSKAEYWQTLRPDIERLFALSSDAKFRDSKFWGPAESAANKPVSDGYKMKWHNMGSGRIQLRLGVVLIGPTAWLCHAWSKTKDAEDQRQCMALRHRITLIRAGQARIKGEIHERRT